MPESSEKDTQASREANKKRLDKRVLIAIIALFVLVAIIVVVVKTSQNSAPADNEITEETKAPVTLPEENSTETKEPESEEPIEIEPIEPEEEAPAEEAPAEEAPAETEPVETEPVAAEPAEEAPAEEAPAEAEPAEAEGQPEEAAVEEGSGQEAAGAEEGSDGESTGEPGEDGADWESDGDSAGGLGGLNENFDVDDIPQAYLKTSSKKSAVENVYYTTTATQDSKSCAVYLPDGYDDDLNQYYNVLYILHASGGEVKNYLYAPSPTKLQRLLDNMIENGELEPLIVVAATYYPSESFLASSPLDTQVNETKDFPQELVNDIIPAVESKYRTYAYELAQGGEVTLEEIVASRNHRGIAGFSLGGVATWNVFIQQMQAFKWFLPLSEASWDDGEGGLTGILDSDSSAETLYEAVTEQGYGKDDFMLFVATGGDDEAFDITTTQMVSLLEYADMFQPGENVSCSMMNNGKHNLNAVYTYLYHIMPVLFYGE